ncbi:hypothetical protein Hanom_Chr02g00161931 [Helianthus anomalus]
MDLVRLRARERMRFWTEDNGRSVTSRQVEERERSVRVRVLEVEADLVAADRVLRVDKMTESGFRRFLKGRRVVVVSSSESESESARRRFPILE